MSGDAAAGASVRKQTGAIEPVSQVDRSVKQIIVASAVLAGLGVAIGAYGAHGLETTLAGRIDDADLLARRVGQFNVGVRYHLVHAVAMLAVAALPLSPVTRRRVAIGLAMGVLLFSGSLYLLVMLEIPVMGAVTPLGGLAWILTWTYLAIAAARA